MPNSIRRYIDDWLSRHNPPKQGSIILHRRRLYIVPTRFGYFFALLLVVLFLTAVNYQNSLIFVLTFMLTALAITSLWKTHQNLLGIEVDLKTPKPVFNGESCNFQLTLRNARRCTRYAVGMQYGLQTPVYVKIPPNDAVTAEVSIPMAKRGRFKPQGLFVFSRYPTGLFHTWGWLKFDRPVLIYAKPLDNICIQESFNAQSQGRVATITAAGDDFHGLRAYRKGESLRHVAWKAHAQGKGLLTKVFHGQGRHSLWIDWSAMQKALLEERVSEMTSWVLQADDADLKYGVKLPGICIEQARGVAHRQACLSAIATFKQTDLDAEFPLDDAEH